MSALMTAAPSSGLFTSGIMTYVQVRKRPRGPRPRYAPLMPWKRENEVIGKRKMCDLKLTLCHFKEIEK